MCEELGATWNEFNLTKKVWTIPATRMKAGVERRVSLSDRALDILRKIPRDGSEPVFACDPHGMPRIRRKIMPDVT